ncbi:MAG: cytochrome c oxidase subunit 3 [Bacteroidetes bacterium]|nr:cytochrome c oxidase subunit 3 [Bacteroidota bacterium]
MEANLDIDDFILRKQKAQRNLMWLGTLSIIMIFAGLTSAYVVRRGAGDWFSIVLPQVFWVSTAVIIFSSISMNFALWSFRKNKIVAGKLFLGTTLFLGLLFSFCQFLGWGELTRNGVYLVQSKGQTSLISGSFIFLLSGLHLAHVVGGIIALIFIFIKSLMGRYSSSNVHGLRVAAIYWHFLDLLWIYLFVFLTIYK